MVSLNAFRNCLNEYLDDVEIGNEAAWRARRGVSAGNLQAY